MDGTFDNSAENGYVEIIKLPPLPEQHPAATQVGKRSLYVWYPPDNIAAKLPANHCLALECWLFHDGIRRFSPASFKGADKIDSGVVRCDTTAFALNASIGGRALMWRKGEQNPFPLLSFEEGRLFFQFAWHLREHLGPSRDLGEALRVCAAGRNCGGDNDVLPADIGLDRNGDGVRWTVSRLEDEGRQAANSRGLLNPTKNDVVRLGLLAAADCNPLEISDIEANRITRMTLFALGPDVESVTDEDVSFVAGCVRKAIRKNLNVSDERFRAWIEDSNSSLIRSIRRSSGNKLSRPQIRVALLNLAWDSVMSFAKTVDIQMRTFRDAIREEFSPEEEFLFEQCYFASPLFGGLPMILLHDRLAFLNEALTDFWLESGSPLAVARVRTMLYYYGVIVGGRREADRIYKQRSRANGVATGAVCEVPMPEDFDPPSKSTSKLELIREAARVFAIEKKLLLPHSVSNSVVTVVACDDDSVCVEVFVSTDQHKSTFVVSRDEFDELVQKLARRD